MDKQDVIEKLSKIKLFHTVKDDEESLTKLARIVTWQQCKAGVEIISEGVEGDDAYILYRGVVKIHKRTPDQEPYTIVALRDDEDVFFGELALMDKEVRSASVIAETDCELLVIHRDNFIQLGEEDPRLGLLVTRAIARELSKRLRKANQDMVLLFEALVEQVAESGGLEEE
jgi:CRP/FNR family cyclic AMP-dependent transcriptional regulator